MQPFNSHVDGYYDAGDQMKADLRRRAEAHFRRQEQEKAALITIEAFESHRLQMRANFMDAIGGLPQERTPLNARVTGVVEQEKYVIEKTIYESQPEFFVTAVRYVPKNLTEPAPAIVFVHGHADASKEHPPYQAVCIDLAHNGFIVFAIDPIGQGERSQYFEDGHRVYGSGGYEHTHAGLQFFPRGACIARHFIWDVMRGVDYLESRPDVDAQRIGITGSSGGGTQTCHLMMSEPRLAAAAPCTFVMTLESYMKTGQPQDCEQIIRGCMADGPDHDDFLTALAPKPVLVGAAAYDFFPLEGTQEAVRRARRIYALYGQEDKLGLAIDQKTHEFTPGLRQAVVNWFKQHLRGAAPDFHTGQPDVLPQAVLHATTSGQVLTDFPNSKTVFDLNRRELPPASPQISVHEQRTQVAEVLGVLQAGDRSAAIYPRVISDAISDGYRTEKIFFFSAPDVVVTAVMAHPRGAERDAVLPATLLLLENGTNDIPANRPLIESLLRREQRVLIFDPRGLGGVAAHPVNPTYHEVFGTEYKLACDAMMLGLSTLGLRVFDVLRGYDYLKTRADVASVNLYGKGSGAIFAYFAAVLEEGFAELTVEDMLCSYRHLCETRHYQRALYNLKIMAWGLLRSGDLADLAPCLKSRPTTFIHPRNAFGEPWEQRD
ncbi:MAG TPA: prolyl oligopeptidase family serine peptidase [Abditibacteriaceae bacterium]|nr:prolyl oligopeptidase family serine peptidase [Abditibacteriaceae bacterium]